MKHLLAIACLVACGTNLGGDDTGLDNCLTDTCLCPTTEGCDHTCEPGGIDCRVACSPGLRCDVICDPGEACRVEGSSASEVDVDCRGTNQCYVTCPATGCTVSNCSHDCRVTCGLTGIATHHGSTATCP
jgi:hypothetical protein